MDDVLLYLLNKILSNDILMKEPNLKEGIYMSAENLTAIIELQKKSLADLEKEINKIKNSDINKQNKILTEESTKIKQNLLKLEGDLELLKKENKDLKQALFDYTYSDKINVVNVYEKKADIYFSNMSGSQINRLETFKNGVLKRMNELNKWLLNYNISIEGNVLKQLKVFEDNVTQYILKAQTETTDTINSVATETKQGFGKFKKEPVTDEQIKNGSKKNNLESFFGLNILNKVGIFLIIIGVFAASQYAYFRLSNELKGALIFVLGVAVLLSGEFLNKKISSVFSLGLIAGGVSILYIGVAVSYFSLSIIGMIPALVLCIMVTAVAFFLSIRNNSQVISCFALIGGYIPLVTILDNSNLLMGSMVYFLILNALVLFISFKKKWRITSFIGLSLNIVSTWLISTLVSLSQSSPSISVIVITLGFVFVSFGIYSAVPLISTYKTKAEFKISEIIFMAINTVFSSLIIYIVSSMLNLDNMFGIITIIFAVIYIALSRIAQKLMPKQKRIVDLFYLTAFAFVILVIPTQFGVEWLSMGWLAEGILLASYGILKEDKQIKGAGIFIYALCLGSFVLFDISSAELFTFKYSIITLSSLIILGMLVFKNKLIDTFHNGYKYVCTVNFWFYCMYIIFKEISSRININGYNNFYLITSLAISVTYFIAFVIPKLPWFKSNGDKNISNILYVIGIAAFIGIGFLPSFNVKGHQSTTSIYILGTIVILVLTFLSVASLYNILKRTQDSQNKLPLYISVFFLAIMTQNLIIQYDISFTSIAISIIYAVMAVIWIYIGFVKNLVFMRRIGLGLTVFSVAKLFIIDLYTLTEGRRIISYFALGITLIVISFIYQKFSKKLELQGSIVNNEKKNIQSDTPD